MVCNSCRNNKSELCNTCINANPLCTETNYVCVKGVHDIIHIERTHRWVCSCGKAGFLNSELSAHRNEIELEKVSIDIQNKRVQNLTEAVDKA